MSSYFYWVRALAIIWGLANFFIILLGQTRAKIHQLDIASGLLIGITVGFFLPAIQYLTTDNASVVGRYTWGFPYLNLFGLLLLAAGIALQATGIRTLGKQWSVHIKANHPQLIRKGVYGYIRHPIYTGLLLQFLGFSIIMSNWLAYILIFLPNFASFYYRCFVEEKVLTSKLGPEYLEYQKTTKRIIPGVL